MPDHEPLIPKLEFMVAGKKVVYDFEREVQIDADHLNQSLINQPSKFAFIATASAAYQGSVEGAKATLDLESAKLDALIREQMTNGGEKITEDKVKAAITSHPRYQEAYKKYMMQSQIARQLQVAVEAFRQRMQMLISLANNYRAELDMNLFTKKADYEKLIEGRSTGRSKH